MATDVKAYPVLQRILRREWDEYRRTHGRISLRDAAEQMGMKSPSALHSWLRGERLPIAKNIETLAKFFHSDDDDKRKRLESEIRLAVTAVPVAALRDPLEGLVNGTRELAIGVIEYEPFSGKDSDFFNQVFDRFAAFANLSKLEIRTPKVTLDEAQSRLCDTGELDMVLGVLQTPDRALRLRFFTSPIRIPVNAVLLSESEDVSETVVEALWERRKDVKPLRFIYPIINEKEVGGLHVRNYLDINQDQSKSVDYKVESYVQALLESYERRSRGGGPVPVVVADELMCLQVKRRLNSGGLLSRTSKQPSLQAVLVSPESRAPESRDTRPSSSPPRYRLCFAVNRNHRSWIDYLADAFEIFLDSNAELVAGYYKELHDDIKTYVQGVGGRDGAVVANRWLSLDEASRVTGSWGEIVTRAANLLPDVKHLAQRPTTKGKKK